VVDQTRWTRLRAERGAGAPSTAGHSARSRATAQVARLRSAEVPADRTQKKPWWALLPWSIWRWTSRAARASSGFVPSCFLARRWKSTRASPATAATASPIPAQRYPTISPPNGCPTAAQPASSNVPTGCAAVRLELAQARMDGPGAQHDATLGQLFDALHDSVAVLLGAQRNGSAAYPAHPCVNGRRRQIRVSRPRVTTSRRQERWR